MINQFNRIIKIICLRVFSRFCEIQNIPIGKDTDLTYDDLLSINAKYSDLSKCPELKVSIKSIQENILKLVGYDFVIKFLNTNRKIHFEKEYARLFLRMLGSEDQLSETMGVKSKWHSTNSFSCIQYFQIEHHEKWRFITPF